MVGTGKDKLTAPHSKLQRITVPRLRLRNTRYSHGRESMYVPLHGVSTNTSLQDPVATKGYSL